MISVIVPSYNKAKYIKSTINSVLQQTYSDWELIVVDDKSTDETALILQTFVSIDKRIRIYFNETNLGGNFSRNKGVELAMGDYVLFLDADDVLEPFCLEERVKKIELHPTMDLWVFPMGVFIKEKGDQDFSNFWIPPQDNFFLRFLSNNLPWSVMQPIWRKSIFIAIGGFDKTFPLLQDVEIHTKALLNQAKVITFPLNSVDCYYRVDEVRLTTSKLGYIQRWVDGALMYYGKFYNLVGAKEKKYLSGTLLQVLGVILFNYREKQIDKTSFDKFKNELIQGCLWLPHVKYLKLYVFFNQISPIYPRGLKYLIRSLMNINIK